jgi:hypothetical protein
VSKVPAQNIVGILMIKLRLRLYARLALAFACAGVLGCGDDDGASSGRCDNCEYWTQLTTGGAQFPAAHPTRSDVIAFSSARADSTGTTEDIWIREAVGDSARYYRVTDDAGDEQFPSWSPDGTRLAFSRARFGRDDLWVANVSTYSDPTDLQKLTSEDLVPFKPGRSSWRDGNALIFSNGRDIFELDLTRLGADALVELVQDPADIILGLGLSFIEHQPAFVRTAAGAERLAFISEGRGPGGSIQVDAFAETGEQVVANIFVDQKPLLTPPPDSDTLQTPFLIGGIAPMEYVVSLRVGGGPEDFCDTLLMIPRVRVFPNQITPLEFIFTRPRGAIRVIGPPIDGSVRVNVVSLETGDLFTTGNVFQDTTIVDCLWPGNYRVTLIRASQVIDSAFVEVCERKLSQACVSAASAGCDESLTIACIDTLIYEPPPPAAKANAVPRGQAPAEMQAPAMAAGDLWVYDFTTDEFTRLSEDAADQNYPAWSPDGRYLAYIDDVNGELTLRIREVDTGDESVVPLPGRTTTRVCRRFVAHPCWAPSGREILVSLSNCNDEIETNEETDIWLVNVESFLP